MARQHQADLHGFPLEFPGTEIASIPDRDAPLDENRQVPSHPWDPHDLGPYGCVTVYGRVDGKVPGVVRFNLFAELFGVRSLVASAFVGDGEGGVLMTAQGIVADRWSLTGQASSPAIKLRGALISTRGCAHVGVRVPTPFRFNRLENTSAELVGPDAAPLEVDTGVPEFRTIAAPGPGFVIQFSPGERLIYGEVKADDGAAGSFTVRQPDTSSQVVSLDAGQTWRSNAQGAGLIGVRWDTFVNVSNGHLLSVR